MRKAYPITKYESLEYYEGRSYIFTDRIRRAIAENDRLALCNIQRELETDECVFFLNVLIKEGTILAVVMKSLEILRMLVDDFGCPVDCYNFQDESLLDITLDLKCLDIIVFILERLDDEDNAFNCLSYKNNFDFEPI